MESPAPRRTGPKELYKPRSRSDQTWRQRPCRRCARAALRFLLRSVSALSFVVEIDLKHDHHVNEGYYMADEHPTDSDPEWNDYLQIVARKEQISAWITRHPAVRAALLTDLGYGAVLIEAGTVPTVWAGR